MEIIATPKILKDLWLHRKARFQDMMKVVVDVNRGVLAIDADMHADLEALLLEQGSVQQDLWGANVYPEMGREHPDFMDTTALVNVRPSMGNKTMQMSDPATRDRMKAVVMALLV
jgi:hypothetical protein